MSRYYSYINSAKDILSVYNGEEPFASFVKKYFAQHKKYGSKDRKQISHLCYCYFRLGKSNLPFPLEERIVIGLFFCSDRFNDILEALRPEWNKQVTLALEEKCSLLNIHYAGLQVFPWSGELSKEIEPYKFSASFFIQPDLFLRIRPGKKDVVIDKLETASIDFKIKNDDCLVLSNSVKIDEVIELNREAVVQDYSSQRVGELLAIALAPPFEDLPISNAVRRARQAALVWDCCAASGGKSIMAFDLDPSIQLTVSDIRESILVNLRKRFKEAGIKNYQSFTADLSVTGAETNSSFDCVICDAPCTGSGTWSRTPEQLYYFDEEKIKRYASLQKKIVSNIIPAIAADGHLLYITCSVFKKENEEITRFIQDKFALELVDERVITGYEEKADTMFAALFRKTKATG